MLKLNILGVSKCGEPLCPTCVNSVMQRGFEGEQLTCCMLGGTLRELTFAVQECTAYGDARVQKPQRVAGFIKPEPPQQQHYVVVKIA